MNVYDISPLLTIPHRNLESCVQFSFLAGEVENKYNCKRAQARNKKIQRPTKWVFDVTLPTHPSLVL